MCKFYSQTSQINNCKTLQPSSWQMIYWHDIQMCFASALTTGVPELVTKVINGSLNIQPWKTGNIAIFPLQFIENHLSLHLQEVATFFRAAVIIDHRFVYEQLITLFDLVLLGGYGLVHRKSTLKTAVAGLIFSDLEEDNWNE